MLARKKISLGLRKELEAIPVTPETAAVRHGLIKFIMSVRKMELQEQTANRKPKKEKSAAKKKVEAPQASVNPGVQALMREKDARIRELEAKLEEKPKGE